MNNSFRKTRIFKNMAMVGTICTLISCGGGGGTGFSGPVIPPIDGQWISDGGVSINFDESDTATRFFNRSYKLFADLQDSAAPCGLATDSGGFYQLEAIIDNGSVDFFVGDPDDGQLCLTGVFTSLVSLQVNQLSGESFDTFSNSRVAVRLDLGTWVSSDNTLEAIFFQPSSIDNDESDLTRGCVRTNGTDVVFVSGTINGYDTSHGTNPTIAPLSSESTGESIFESVTFTDVFTLSTTLPHGERLTLERVGELAEPFCEDFS